MSVAQYGIYDKGGNVLCLAELIQTSLAILTGSYTNGTNCLNAGQINKSDIELNTAKTDFENEAKQIVMSDFVYKGLLTGTLMETHKLIHDYVSWTCKDLGYRLAYKYCGVKKGKKQEMFMVGLVTPQAKISAPGGATSMPFQMTAMVQQAAITFTAGDITTLTAAWGITAYTTGSVSIPANQEYVLYES